MFDVQLVLGVFGFCLFVCLFKTHLRPIRLKVLGYQSVMQRYHPACDHEGSFHLFPVLDL